MKLVRIGQVNQEKPAVLIGDKYFDVSPFFTDFNERFFEENGIEKNNVIMLNKVI